MQILVVEDNAVSAKWLESSLEKYGYYTVVARTGKEAIEYLKSFSGIELIILDLMMPEMDGLDFLMALRLHPEWRKIPVIVTTGLADMETVKKAAEMGCADYVVKPIDMPRLLERIRKSSDLRKSILQNSSSNPSETEINPKQFDQMAREFVRQLGGEIARLEQSLQDPNPDLIPELVNLSEGLTVLGMDRVKNILDRLAKEGKKMDRETLDSEYRLLLKELKTLQLILK